MNTFFIGNVLILRLRGSGKGSKLVVCLYIEEEKIRKKRTNGIFHPDQLTAKRL